jgi:hypothetical protein
MIFYNLYKYWIYFKIPDLFLLQCIVCVIGWDKFLWLCLSIFHLDFFFLPPWYWKRFLEFSSESKDSNSNSVPEKIERVGLFWNLNDSQIISYVEKFLLLLIRIIIDRTMCFTEGIVNIDNNKKNNDKESEKNETRVFRLAHSPDVLVYFHPYTVSSFIAHSFVSTSKESLTHSILSDILVFFIYFFYFFLIFH